jgi:hypothetical protein
MFKSLFTMALLGALLLMAAGCSDDEKTTNPPAVGGQTSHLDLVDLEAVIAAVAPPEFTAPIGAPSGTDSLSTWTSGGYPLLGKVFGNEDPQTLYRNLNDFKDNMGVIMGVALVDENGDLVTGQLNDSAYIGMDGDSLWVHFVATVTALENPTAVPQAYQTVLGSTLDVDYMITVDVSEMEGSTQLFGVTVNDSTQTLAQFGTRTSADGTESNLLYATLNLTDSTFVFRGVGYVAHQSGDLFGYGYNMSSETSSDFAYRMSWFSDSPGLDETLLGCIIGGGNKDVEFAMKYRQYMPADSAVMDSACMYDQVFGPNYSEGTGLISDYESYLADELIYTYEAIPTGQITSPWTE